MSLGWQPARVPNREPLAGVTVRLEPLDPARHARALFEASHDAEAGESLFRYLPYGPFAGFDEFKAWLEQCAASKDPLFLAIIDLESDSPRGMASFMRMAPEHGVIEIGHIWFAPSLQRTRSATEAIYLMARHAFDGLGNRRLEWKCDALNEPSRRAAERFGFTFEGVFRQHLVVKDRNRDSAWFSILDGEWPVIRAGFEAWLAPDNFDADGRQRQSLSAIRDAIAR
ncbi:MAG TPA: GNAT family protein [Candidatus Dormibacteraeota bacterium]|nr:GNAT family protein [Candidatus Dormibacteraeota bacterium]